MTIQIIRVVKRRVIASRKSKIVEAKMWSTDG